MKQDRNITLRENYRRLREAGFTAKEAERFRGSSESLILEALKTGKLPELREEKRGRARVKQRVIFIYETNLESMDEEMRELFIQRKKRKSKIELLSILKSIIAEIQATGKRSTDEEDEDEEEDEDKQGGNRLSISLSLSPDTQKEIEDYYAGRENLFVVNYPMTSQKKIIIECMFALQTYIGLEALVQNMLNLLPFLRN